MWYAIQTLTGKEQELIDAIGARTDHNTYERCFCVRRESVWRRAGRYIAHIETLFPGYVFAETANPEAFYLQLKKIPQFSRFLGKNTEESRSRKNRKNIEKDGRSVRDGTETDACGGHDFHCGGHDFRGYGYDERREEKNEIVFHAVSPEEEEFLKRLIGEDPENIVRLSPVELDENSEIVKCGGALRC